MFNDFATVMRADGGFGVSLRASNVERFQREALSVEQA
jgi:hypothetical protein